MLGKSVTGAYFDDPLKCDIGIGRQICFHCCDHSKASSVLPRPAAAAVHAEEEEDEWLLEAAVGGGK